VSHAQEPAALASAAGAISGRFVKQSMVKKNPNTTVNESTKKK